MRRTPLILLLLSVLALPFATGARAADAPDSVGVAPARDSVRVSESAPPRDSVVVAPVRDSIATARAVRGVQDTVTVLPPIQVETGRPEIPTRATATQVRLDRTQIQRFIPSTPADALIAAPGVELIRTSPWATRVSVRGYSGERVLLMVDGVRLNSGRGHGALSSLVGVDKLFQVDVSPGAASAQYGSDAMGGVVNLVTHRDLLTPFPAAVATVRLRGSNPDGGRSQFGRIAYTGPRMGAELSGALSRLSGLSTPDGMIPNSASHDEDLTGRVMARLGVTTVDFEHAHHAARDVGLPAFNSSAGASGEYPLQGRDADRLELIARPAGGRQEWRLLGSDQRFLSDFNEQVVDSAFVRGRLVALKTTRTADQLDTRQRSVQPSWQVGTRSTLRLGAEYRREQTSGPRNTQVVVANTAGTVTSDTQAASESVPPATRDVWSGSAASAVPFAGFRFETGARYEWMRSQADSTPISSTSELEVIDRRLSVEGGVSRSIGAIQPYAHIATGFRAPNLEERYYNSEIHGGMRLFGNPALEAENSLSYEAGVRAAGARGAVSVTAYRSELENYITLAYLGQLYLIPRFQYTNVTRARIEGIEVNGRVPAGNGSLGVSAAFPRGRDLETGERLTDVGAARVMVDLTQSVAGIAPQGVIALRARWTNSVPEDPSASEEASAALTRPAFWVASAELGFMVMQTRATFAVRNLFDLRYREPLSFIDEPGRTFAFSLQRDFNLPLRGRSEMPHP